jgi:alginate O-acetyltransferase complex protein AlgI
VNEIFANPNPTGFQTLMAAYAFAFQIYCDFSGYTDIARGLAKVMGFEFVLNFKSPYFSTNPRDFWGRWHISLSTWLRDYLYIPLGGNKRGELRTLANLMITMVLGGLWHGARWNFVLWGAYQGLLLVGYRLWEPDLRRASQGFSPAWRPITFSVSVFGFFHVICYGWLLFRAESLNQIHVMTASLLDPVSAMDMGLVTKILFLASPVILEHIFQYFPNAFCFVMQSRFLAEVRAVWYALLSYLVLFRGGDAQSFIYFQF